MHEPGEQIVGDYMHHCLGVPSPQFRVPIAGGGDVDVLGLRPDKGLLYLAEVKHHNFGFTDVAEVDRKIGLLRKFARQRGYRDWTPKYQFWSPWISKDVEARLLQHEAEGVEVYCNGQRPRYTDAMSLLFDRVAEAPLPSLSQAMFGWRVLHDLGKWS